MTVDAGDRYGTVDVLVVGAGPTGLVLALWLTKLGMRVRIVDRRDEGARTSRALAIQARTLELYRQLDLADEVIAQGHRTRAFRFWADGEQRGSIEFADALRDLTPFPFLLTLPQDRHEEILAARLEAMGVVIERGTELFAFREVADGVHADLYDADGDVVTASARYLAGCDGAGSTVRSALDIGFGGGTYDRFFYVADIEAGGPTSDGAIHINLADAEDFLAVFPLPGDGKVRLVGTVREGAGYDPDTLTFEDVSAGGIEKLQVDIRQLDWFSTYRVHHRVADRFRCGHAFLLGDAGHIHSPAGGQGMNTGIGDAINLAWKIAAVVRNGADDKLLDSYEAERIGFARRLVATTDKVFTAATSSSRLAQFWRRHISPRVVPVIERVAPLRRFGFATVAQLRLNYRGGPLAEGRAGRVRGGDRLPWRPVGGTDTHDGLTASSWHLRLFGAADAALADWCARRGVGFRHFPWQADLADAGFAEGGVYLVRPDGYVAVAAEGSRLDALDAFLVGHSLGNGAKC